MSPPTSSRPLGFRSCSRGGASSKNGVEDNQQSFSLKVTIQSEGKAKLCKSSNFVDREDSEGLGGGGSTHRGSSVLVFSLDRNYVGTQIFPQIFSNLATLT